jgi:CoA:oxalate CoA-transferase
MSNRPPLEGITVLDLGQIYQGPYCGFLLALAGAEVIKVEPPGGEAIRMRADVSGRASLPMAMVNSNKRGISLNLKHETGRELFLKMVDRADVLIENYMPGVMDRLGLGGRTLLERNPRLVFASASGFGSTGPYRDMLAMDLTIQAISGMMSVTGFPDSDPLKAGPSVCDFLGGSHLYSAITTALYARERTGRGTLVESAMMDSAYITLASNLGMMHDRAAVPPRTGNRHGGLAMAPYNVYPTRDGHVAVICVKNTHWHGLARAMGRDELIDDPRYRTHGERSLIMEEVDDLVANWTRERSKYDVVADALKHHFPAAAVRDLMEASEDPHLHARGMLQRMDHPDLGNVVLPHSPLCFDGVERIPLRASPALGEYNRTWFCETLGVAEEDYARYAEAGVF